MELENESKYNGFITNKGNFIWAAALGLAWNQIIDNFTKQPIKVKSTKQDVQKIVDNFNTCKFSKKDIDDRCIYVKSGYGQKTVDTINQQSKKKFPQKSFTDLKMELKPTDIISYAYLLKKLQFQVKFTRRKQKLLFFNELDKVDSFYASGQKQKKQIKYLYYKNHDQFLITIKAKNPQDQIYILKSPKIGIVDDAINKVMAYQEKGRNSLSNVDQFQMPLVNLDVSRTVDSLIGLQLQNKRLSQYVISYVYQAVKLNIDECGARVQNQAVIVMRQKCIKKIQQPKYFILNKQFWVIMKEKGKWPYFCTNIRNPIEN